MQSTRQHRITRHARIRKKITGTKTRPRLSVFRSNKHLHLQLVDDEAGKTLVSASSREAKTVSDLGKLIAEKAGKAGIKAAVFDRGGYQYHGKIAQLATAAREAGLKI